VGMSPRRFGCSVLAVFGVIGAVVAPSGSATAQQTQQAAQPCDAFDVEYSLAAKLQLTDTPSGAGDGIYNIGPGTVVLRFANTNGQPSGDARMRSYFMKERFNIESHTVFWTTHVFTDSKTTATPDRCGDIARGELQKTTLRWLTPVSGYRTDGTIVCDGSLCGKFGAPPSGKSELHIEPHPVTFNPFEFAPDMKTFKMGTTLVSKTESPKQTAQIALGGRETRRTCVRVAPCP
jgi:hypothetical protein